ncbi:unnamed protein product [Leptidea sinapis]|uniref:Uncharacterized protein n=1 Tax=Leptidea sinapis TaxID=189913 RepID=A0A5E4R1G8_9NEOP|nr:unnamed protein product [Leptidea sinapis]
MISQKVLRLKFKRYYFILTNYKLKPLVISNQLFSSGDKDSSKDPGKDAIKIIGKEGGNDAVKDVERDGNKDVGRDAGKDKGGDAGKLDCKCDEKVKGVSRSPLAPVATSASCSASSSSSSSTPTASTGPSLYDMLGPCAGKQCCYKNPEYFSFHHMSFYDFHYYLRTYRQPCPKTGRKP